tara:strand:+ start:5682 stop:5918 length:237 start_codon:yes stop_codon:yes gene_type:complete
MNLVSVVIKEKYGKVPAASKATGQYTTQLYRWIEMGALVDREGNVFRYQDGATVDRDGESVLCKVYVWIGKFSREVSR